MPTLAALAIVALLVSLGRWQTNRAQEKEARQALLEARTREPPLALGGSSGPAEALLYRRVRTRGRWIPEGQIFIDNQVREGRAGFSVVAPLRLAGGDGAVLINRGWIARTNAYPRAPEVGMPSGDVFIEGVATTPPARFLELSSETVSGNVWQNLTLDKYKTRTGIEVLPVVVLAQPPAEGLAFVHEKPDFGVGKHREYALTWFSLAATVAVLWLVFAFRRLAR